MSRSRKPPGERRVLVYGRVHPDTLRFLKTMGETNFGRTVDRLVEVALLMQRELDRLDQSRTPRKDIRTLLRPARQHSPGVEAT